MPKFKVEIEQQRYYNVEIEAPSYATAWEQAKAIDLNADPAPELDSTHKTIKRINRYDEIDGTWIDELVDIR